MIKLGISIVRIKAITLNDNIVAAYFYIKDEVTLFAPINLETECDSLNSEQSILIILSFYTPHLILNINKY